MIKNGKIVSKQDIEEMDVVYSVADVNGNNRSIFVYNDKAEGDIKGFSPNGPAPTSVQIDSTSYSFSKDIDLGAVSKFKEFDKVAALLGHDGKVVELRKIDYKTGKEIEVKILGNNKTSDSLIDNQVLTDSGKYYVLGNASTLEVGGKYKVNVDGDTIVSVKNKQNALYNYSIRRVSENTIYYGGGEDPSSTILPQLSTYYYHGVKTDYETVLNSLKLGSSVILAANNGIYDYGVIVDPVYSKPVIMSFETKDAIDSMNSDENLFIYKNGEYYDLTGFIETGDVVYSVSDLWNINKYIYVTDTQVKGRIKNILPNKVNPKSIQIDSITYNISKHFDVSKLNKAKVDSYVKITLDMDGKIIDIDIY
jgi:hypothetical protein